MATEVEIKLAFTADYKEAALPSLRNALDELKLNAVFKKRHLENAYFDTPEFALHAHKVALRIRRKLSDQGQPLFIQTLKTSGQSRDGLSRRGEWEWPLLEAELDLETLAACEGWPVEVDALALQTVFETNFTRYACELTWGKSVIELVLDWGEIISNSASERIHEIELELKQGDTGDLLVLSQRLRRALPVTPLDISKAERGFNLYKAGQNMALTE